MNEDDNISKAFEATEAIVTYDNSYMPPIYLGIHGSFEMDVVMPKFVETVQEQTLAMLSFESRTARNWQFSIFEMERLLQDS